MEQPLRPSIHTKWACKYHVVFIPKCRRRTIYGAIKRELGPVFRAPTEHKESSAHRGGAERRDRDARPPPALQLAGDLTATV